MGGRVPLLPGLAAFVTLAAASVASAATYTVNVNNGMDLQSVATAASGDTVFRISPSTGAVSVQSGAGHRVSTAAANAKVTVTCKASRAGETDCVDRNVSIRIGTVGVLIGRARALTNFTVAMGTATIAVAPTGANPLSFQLAPLGASAAKTFFVGADFPVAGDDSGLPTGNGQNSFYAYVVDDAGLPMASDTDKGDVKAFRALSIAKTADLNFGRIQIPPSGASVITLDAATGARTLTGAAFAYPTPAPSRAAFTVSGEGGQQFSLSIPATLDLTGPASLPVAITSTAPASPSLSGGLGAAGTYSFTIGGSFSITSATPIGAYSGVLSVSLDYN